MFNFATELYLFPLVFLGTYYSICRKFFLKQLVILIFLSITTYVNFLHADAIDSKLFIFNSEEQPEKKQPEKKQSEKENDLTRATDIERPGP